MKASAEYISVGANRSSSCAVCSANGQVAFGAGKYVALWDSESSSRGIKRTLKGHAGQVTIVKSCKEDNGSYQLVSGDSVGEVRLWTTQDNQYTSTSLPAHKGSISALGVPLGASSLAGHILTGGSDGLIKLWKLTGAKPEVVQTIDLKGKLPLDLQVTSLPGSSAPILIAGLTDRRIRIYTFTAGQFHHALSLEGHEDWVRCLSITPDPSSSSSGSTDLLLASGSQDNYIRLWRISRINETEANRSASQGDGGLDMLDEFERKLAGEAGGSVQISTKAHVLSIEGEDGPSRYNITLEALLMGHEAGVTNITWSPSTSSDPRLLSTSSDNSIILWTPSSSSTAKDGIWVPEQRFGATAGRGLGFHGPMWSADGKSIMATGWNGGLERWTEVDKGIWEPRSGLSGHFGSVESCVWADNGNYLLSVGADQTSRMHASTSVGPKPMWAEIARPQIHGYDMTDAAFISPYRFASTGDEKVTRVFDAPGGFVESLQALGISTDAQDASSRPKGATVPPLGLSNRALGKAAEVSDLPTPHVANPAIDSVSKAFSALPTEEELSTTTLWPEVEKVYGHGYELVTLAASHDGKLIATACRASNTDHAVVRVVSTETWDAVGEPLTGHSLSMTRIAFSPDDKLVLTCSRDRGWRLFSKKSNAAEGFEPLARDERAHSRMVLDCCWSPDGSFFATASRDKTVKLWKQNPNHEWIAVGTIKMNESVTAAEMTSTPNGPLLAIGTESGAITLYIIEVKDDSLEAKLVHEVEKSDGHCSTINRLAFRPGKEGLMLASSSDDRSLRLFALQL